MIVLFIFKVYPFREYLKYICLPLVNRLQFLLYLFQEISTALYQTWHYVVLMSSLHQSLNVLKSPATSSCYTIRRSLKLKKNKYDFILVGYSILEEKKKQKSRWRTKFQSMQIFMGRHGEGKGTTSFFWPHTELAEMLQCKTQCYIHTLQHARWQLSNLSLAVVGTA